MELGGNKAAKAFYEKNGMLPTGSMPDHKNPALSRYKNQLKINAQKAIGLEPTPTEAAPATSKPANSFGGNNIILKMEAPTS